MRQPPRNPRFPALDAWRGVACLMVVIHHTTSLAWYAGPGEGSTIGALLLAATRYGHFGVPLFFVISGYCVTATADLRSR